MNGSAPQDAKLQFLVSRFKSLTGIADEPVESRCLVGDGSDRRFFRLRCGPYHCVALVSPRQVKSGIDENDSYYRIGKHLCRLGVPVPGMLWADPDHGQFLLEDVGDFHLQRQACRGRTDLFALYRNVLRLLVHLHQQAPQGFRPSYCFDTVRYDPSFVVARELEYFRKAFLLTYLQMDAAPEDLNSDFENLAEAAGVPEPSLIIHRDFQSRNLMVYRGRLRLLDFQGMRYGPPAYDLASLLLDPYVELPDRLQDALVELYWTGARRFLGGSYARFKESYTAVRLCRNLQVLGAYGYLGACKGKTQFLHYIPQAWRRLRQWLYGPCKGRYPKLQAWVGMVEAHRRDQIHSGGDLTVRQDDV